MNSKEFDALLAELRKGAAGIQKISKTLGLTLPSSFPAQVVMLNDCLDVYSASKTMISAVVDDAAGGFTLESVATLSKDFDANWDNFAEHYNDLFKKLSNGQQDNILETFATTQFSPSVFNAGSVIKNETPAILGGIVSFNAGINAFGGSWRDPQEAAMKIKTGVNTIVQATEQIANSLNNVIKFYENPVKPENAAGSVLLERLGKLHETKLVGGAISTVNLGADGIAVYGNVAGTIGNLGQGDLKGAIGNATAAAKKVVDDIRSFGKGVPTGAAANIGTSSGISATGNADQSKTQVQEQNAAEKNDSDSAASDSYVCSTATMKCSYGDRTAKLTVYPDRTVFLTGQPMANISDHVSMYNIAAFGKCHTVSFPPTGSATAANHGKLTPMPCIPGTVSEWQNGKDDYIIKGKPALLKSSWCRCQWGGIVTITDDGQTDTGLGDNSGVTIQAVNNFEFNVNSILDKIQIALDVAGLVPLLGTAPDLLNAAISAARGDWMGVGISLVAAVPGLGDAATAAKFAYKGVKAVKTIGAVSEKRLAKEAKKYVGEHISKDELFAKGICKSNDEAEFFYKALRTERKDFAYQFYKNHGVTDEAKIMSHINGIDLNNPVKVKKASSGTLFQRYEVPGDKGSYYGLPRKAGEVIRTPRHYGIQPVIVKEDGTIVRKRKVNYKVDCSAPEFEYLESTAAGIRAPLNNKWDTSKADLSNWKNTKGGAVQVYIPYEFLKYINVI